MSANTNNIQQLYVAYFGRPADATGLDYWEAVVAARGGSTTAVSAAFAASAEYTATFAGLSNDQIVNTIYNNLFHRDAEVAGLKFWSNLLTAGSINISNVVTQVAGGAQGTDATALAQKVAASVAFTAALDTTPEILSYNGTGAVTLAKAWLAGIYDATTEAAAVATTALNATISSLTTAVNGQTYTLTTGLDTLTGTVNNDTFNATHLTINAGDIVDGNGGHDTLSIIDSGSAAFTVPSANVSGIETISIRNINGIPAVAGVTETGSVTFQALGAGETVIIGGETFTAGSAGAAASVVAAAFVADTVATASGTAFGFAVATGKVFTATAGSSVNNILFTSGTAGNVSDIVISGTAQTGIPQVTDLLVGTGVAATTPITFTYNGVTLTTAAAGATTINAAASAIANAINAYAGSTISVANGTAGHVVTTAPTAVSLAGWSATSLVITSYTLTTGLVAASPATVVETQGVLAVTSTSATDTVNVGNFAGATSFISDSSTGNVTFAGNLTAAQSVTLKGNGSSTGGLTATYGATVAAPVINIVGGTATAAEGGVSVTSAGATTVTINSTGAANSIGKLTVANSAGTNATATVAIHAATNLTATSTDTLAKNITIDGAATSVVLGTLTDATLAITIDASGLTAGGTTLALLSNVASFKGGAGADVITTAGLTAVVAGEIDGGLGANTLVIGAATDINSAVKAAEYINFQTVKTAVTVDLTYLTAPTHVITTASGVNVTGLSVAQAADVTLQATNAGATFALAAPGGTSDVLSINLQNATPALVATPISFTTAKIDNVETLNVAANSGIATAMTAAIQTAAGYDAVSFTSASTLKSIVATGAYDLDINVGTTTAVKVTSIDLSGTTNGGNTVELGGNTGALVVTGSNAADIITLGSLGTGGTVTLNTGLGNDTVIGTATQIAAATSINGGGGTGDTLSYSDTTGTLTINDGDFHYVSGIEKIKFGATEGTLSFTAGHYADILATANGGVLDVTVAALTSGPATINAASLSGTNSLKLALTDTGGSTTGILSVTGSIGGTDSITVSRVTSGSGNITINESANTSAGVYIDTHGIAVSSGATAISGGAGADTILGGVAAAGYTGNAGNDTITLLAGHTGAQTVVFSGGVVADAASVSTQLVANGLDTINGFTSGTDKLTVTALGDGTQVLSTAVLITAAGAVQPMTNDILYVVGASGAAAHLMSSGTAVVTDFTNLTQVSAYLTERFTVTASAQHNTIIFNDTSGSNDTSYVYTLSNVGANTTIDAVDIALVGVVHHTAGTALILADAGAA